jgi:hypothetical protein
MSVRAKCDAVWSTHETLSAADSDLSNRLFHAIQPSTTASGQKDLRHDPRVVFIGDETTHGWLASGVLAQHPMWIDKSSTTLETSASMLARFPDGRN